MKTFEIFYYSTSEEMNNNIIKKVYSNNLKNAKRKFYRHAKNWINEPIIKKIIEL